MEQWSQVTWIWEQDRKGRHVEPFRSFLLSSMKSTGYKHSLNLRRYCYSVTPLCPTLCDPMDCSKPAFPILYHHPELAQTHVSWVGDPSHLVLGCPLLFLPSIFPSIRVLFFFFFSSESVLLIRWLKYWSFSISTSKECVGYISFGIGWFDFLEVHGILKSLLQRYISKASII